MWPTVASGVAWFVCHYTTTVRLFNGLFSRTTWVSWHQKRKAFWIFAGARDDGVAVASAGPYANHLHLTPDR